MTKINDHFLIAGEIWEEYFEGRRTLAWGKLGITKRDEILEKLRNRLMRRENRSRSRVIKSKPSVTAEDKAEMMRLAQECNKPITRVRSLKSGRDPVERMIAVMDLLEDKK